MAELFELLAPIACPGCGAKKVSLCSHCQALLNQDPIILEHSVSIRGCRIPVLSGGVYEGVRQSVMVNFKNGSQYTLAKPLMSGLVAAMGPPTGQASAAINIAPIPSSLRGQWNRGYAPSLLLAQALGPSTKAIVWKRLVVQRWQMGLAFHPRKASSTRTSRPQRSSRDVRITRPGRGEKLVLLDDVLVTGATVRAAATALMDAGYVVVAVVVAAHVPDGSSSSSLKANGATLGARHRRRPPILRRT